MKLSQIFGFNKKCTHSHVPIEEDYYYCPDCGELVENKWYLTRCSCCGLKLPATAKDGEVMPLEKFCHNCGGKGYTLERIDKIDCININYAVLVREIVNLEIPEYTQSWADVIQTSGLLPKLQR